MTRKTLSLISPAPWHAVVDSFDHGGGYAGFIEDATGCPVADVAVDEAGGPVMDVAVANIHLMVAAPDLLKAIEDAVADCCADDDGEPCSWCRPLLGAANKARGIQ